MITSPDYTATLQSLMRSCGITTYVELCQVTGVSEKVIRRLRRGQVAHMQIGTLTKIAQGLKVSPGDLLNQFSGSAIPPQSSAQTHQAAVNAITTPQSNALQQEYDRLKTQLAQQRETLQQEFQQASLQVIESWMLQWPTAAYAATNNPNAPAVKLLPLVKPIENLLQSWGLTPIGQVGEMIPFDPQQHQVMGNTPDSGDLVRVRYIGYRQGDRLLHRAKVSPV